ncbi:PREDICTED: uncharacterized protein LOC104759034 [Camelina sativa]|uniref:Uncharacterized protein LOC104759034 n=1 Tax=Camelina sativa TaxID=90675 RepID=A0ABM0X440_CAMSA|nr:PREDICTED: uncharacterized protein LOC104759034 [Camelina sativa]
MAQGILNGPCANPAFNWSCFGTKLVDKEFSSAVKIQVRIDLPVKQVNMFDDQSLPFSPSWFPPSPEPFPQSMELRQDPTMVEAENMDEVFAGLFSVPAISEATPTTSTQPSLVPFPESLIIPQYPPDVPAPQEQPLCRSLGYLQHSDNQDLLNPNVLNSFQEPDVSTMKQQQQQQPQQSDHQSLLNPNMMYSFQDPDASTMQQQPPLANSHGYVQQSDEQGLLNPNILNSFHEPDVSTMQQHQQPLSNSNGYLQQSDEGDLLQNMLNSFQEPDGSAMQQQQLVCHSNGYVQGNLPNIQSDQQYLSNQNMIMNSLQDPNNSTMINIVHQTEEGNNEYAHQQPLIDSFGLPNHLQDQFLSPPVPENYPSYPAYQHGLIGSHFNMYEQQPPPRALTNREDEHLPPRMVSDLAMTYYQQNQISMIPPQPRMSSSSTRNYFQQNQISMILPQPRMSSSSTSLSCVGLVLYKIKIL